MALDISKAFDRVWDAGHLHKLKSYGISGQIFGFISFLCNRFSILDGKWFWMESLNNNIQLMLEFLKAPFLALHFSCDTLITFLTMLSVILRSRLMILLYSKCDQAFGLWQLELAPELESDLRDTVDWCKKWFVVFIAGKTQLVWFDQWVIPCQVPASHTTHVTHHFRFL